MAGNSDIKGSEVLEVSKASEGSTRILKIRQSEGLEDYIDRGLDSDFMTFAIPDAQKRRRVLHEHWRATNANT